MIVEIYAKKYISFTPPYLSFLKLDFFMCVQVHIISTAKQNWPNVQRELFWHFVMIRTQREPLNPSRTDVLGMEIRILLQNYFSSGYDFQICVNIKGYI